MTVCAHGCCVCSVDANSAPGEVAHNPVLESRNVSAGLRASHAYCFVDAHTNHEGSKLTKKAKSECALCNVKARATFTVVYVSILDTPTLQKQN